MLTTCSAESKQERALVFTWCCAVATYLYVPFALGLHPFGNPALKRQDCLQTIVSNSEEGMLPTDMFGRRSLRPQHRRLRREYGSLRLRLDVCRGVMLRLYSSRAIRDERCIASLAQSETKPLIPCHTYMLTCLVVAGSKDDRWPHGGRRLSSLRTRLWCSEA